MHSIRVQCEQKKCVKQNSKIIFTEKSLFTALYITSESLNVHAEFLHKYA